MEKTDVVLVRPWDYGFEYIEWQEDIQIGFLAAFLEGRGYCCKIVDLAAKQVRAEKDLDKEWEAILRLKPYVVAFVLDKHPTNNPFYATQLVKHFRIKAQASHETPHLTIYGHTQLGTERLLRELPLSSIVTGEEADFTSLVEVLKGNGDLSNASGVSYIDPTGSIENSAPVPISTDLNSLPWPRRYLLEGGCGAKPSRKYVAVMQASRGCYAKCTFCFLRAKEKLYGSYPWRGRSPEAIADEMEYLYRHFGVREFAFVDSQFFGPGANGQKRAHKLSHELIDRGLVGIAFSIYARSESIWPETIATLREAGLYAVFVGIESFNQSVLDRFNKGQTVRENLRAIEILKNHDVSLRMGFITFDYLTTFDEIHQNISALRSVCLEKAHLITQPIFFQNVLVPLEDTPIGKEYEEMGASLVSPIDMSFMSIVEQRRYSCNGAVTDLSDKPWLLAAAEAARILGNEVLRRSNFLELEICCLLENDVQTRISNQVPMSITDLVAWFKDLTPFVVNLFAKIVEIIEKNTEMPLNELEKVHKVIRLACEGYDVEHLQVSLAEIMGGGPREALVV